MTTCSKRCNGERKRLNRRAAAEADGTGEPGDRSPSSSGGEEEFDGDPKAARRAARKAAKAERRAKREGGFAGGQKACDMCGRGVDLLIRCQLSAANEWHLVCARC